jgi:hypothetical protein
LNSHEAQNGFNNNHHEELTDQESSESLSSHISSQQTSEHDETHNEIHGASVATTTTTFQSNDDVDLSKVYWLKLPQTDSDQVVHHKVEEVFSEVKGDGKDALIIPVSRDLTSTQEVSNGFLKAVHARPSSVLKSKYFRNLRSLKIREV